MKQQLSLLVCLIGAAMLVSCQSGLNPVDSTAAGDDHSQSVQKLPPPPAGVHFLKLTLLPQYAKDPEMAMQTGSVSKTYRPDDDLDLGFTKAVRKNGAHLPSDAFDAKTTVSITLDEDASWSGVTYLPHHTFPDKAKPKMVFNFAQYGLTSADMANVTIWYYDETVSDWVVEATGSSIRVNDGEISWKAKHWSTFAYSY